MIAGTSAPLGTPSAPSATVRTAGSGETALSTSVTGVYVAAVNYWGSTAASSATSVTVAAGQVVDVTISPVAGALAYNIWATDGTSHYLLAQNVGGVKYTLQGSLPAAGTLPASDSGTGKATRIEGVIPTLSGVSANAGVYPSEWMGGYVNNAVGEHLNYNVIYTAVKALWDSTSNNPGAFKADPAEIVSSGSDIANLSKDVISQGSATNYQLFITQDQVSNATVGAAVSQFQNPLTRSIMKMVVHPWYMQGNADLISYQLPQTWTNVANAWEMTMVQDYVSIAWPTIDATFRYSIFEFGALVAHAPQYSAHLAGLQQSDTTPYS